MVASRGGAPRAGRAIRVRGRRGRAASPRASAGGSSATSRVFAAISRSGASRCSTPVRRGRFVGTEPEPRAGLRSGHIPGSLNLPYDQLYGPDGTLLGGDALRRQFEAAGLDLGKPIVASCGSGITASVLALGLYALGRSDVAVYDGSWTEWGGRADTAVER